MQAQNKISNKDDVGIQEEKDYNITKYSYVNCPFSEGQKVGLTKNKVRVRIFESVGDGEELRVQKNGNNVFIRKDREEITFIAPRYTYSKPYLTAIQERDEKGNVKYKVGKIENDKGIEERVILCSIPHAFVRIGDKIGCIDMNYLCPKFEKRNW